ncbi:MAG: hypothetical protein A3D17_13510 [Bdellovibrionales bacterium RIFCSPHIGHO2_02_FULL_40_15]|nr:MAG: hypothetical protein A3D17_13510 [Bdellovibrionales bacterium RIFCSPHIGHO2_02_FULL_40_15]
MFEFFKKGAHPFKCNRGYADVQKPQGRVTSRLKNKDSKPAPVLTLVRAKGTKPFLHDQNQ